MLQSTSPGQFLALSQGKTVSRACSTSKKPAILHERMLLLVSVGILLLMSLSLSLTVVPTNAATSPFTVTHPSARPSLSPFPTVTVKHVSSEKRTVGGETDVIPLTLVDLIDTVVAALIPALFGCLFIVAHQRSLRRRKQQQWAGWVQLVQEQGQVGWQEEVDVELEAVGSQEKEQEGLHNEVQTDALQLLPQISVINEHTHSHLARLKCRLRSLPEPLPPG